MEMKVLFAATGVSAKMIREYERDGLRKTAHVELRARKVLEP